MGKLIDLTGERFGRLTVIREGKRKFRPNGSTILYWICMCDCGNTVEVVGGDLKTGRTQSCGCYQRQRAKEYHTKHGMCHTRIHDIWAGMKARCYNPRKKAYHRYGGRGIAVCESWQSFEPFYDWAMGNGYREDLTLDRIDNDGNYCPENCRWVTVMEQANNKSNNKKVAYNGDTRTIAEWSEEFRLPRGVMYDRTRRGWTMERIESTPMRRSVDGHYVT